MSSGTAGYSSSRTDSRSSSRTDTITERQDASAESAKVMRRPQEEFSGERQNLAHKDYPKFSHSLDSAALLDLAIHAAVDLKSFDLRALNMTSVINFTDYFLIVSGTSPRHAQGIADKIISRLKSSGAKPVSVTGYDQGEWIVIDYSDIVIHIFHEPTRQYYEFDELWKQAPLVDMEPDLEKQVRHLRTGRFR